MKYPRPNRLLALNAIAVLLGFLIAQPALSQLTAGDPGANVNIVGPTPDPADFRDDGLKQQNEPSCAIRPGDSACIICGFNDYRTVDVPGIEDAWQGVAMSCDAGTTWTSRIAPGHPLHVAPVGTEFAADPRMIGIHGMAIFNFIGGNRDQDSGVLAIQHWLEVNKEDVDFYEPGKFTYIADTGSSGRFIDKPDAAFLPDRANQQGTITLSTVMENEDLGTITRDFPTGNLFVAYAVFTGNQSVKVLVKDSDNLGQTWQNQVVKLSEDQNLVSGISLTAMGDSVLAVWRRAGDNNDFDSIMYAYTTNRGKKWTKGAVLADICSFDQLSQTTPSSVTFRTNDFPWAANDGKNFYVFYSDRNYDGASNCTAGRPRIVMKHAGTLAALDASSVTVIDDSAPAGSFQFMPAATGANGKVQIAWYDTRRESIAGGPSLIADYFDPESGGQINRKVDVYTARIISDDSGEEIEVSAPVRVSQFRIGAKIEGPPGNQTAGSVAIEGEASFANAKLYASGGLSFIGDYIAVGAEQFRYDQNGKVVSNASPIVNPLVDKTDFFIAWTSNRDVRGNIFDPTNLENTVPYAPPENTPGQDSKAVPSQLLPGHERPEIPMLADASGPPIDGSGVTRTTEGIEDPFNATPEVCAPLDPQDRTRNANIYGSRIRDQVRLKAPTPTKPLTNLQRSFPIALSNVNDLPQTYLLRVTNQPGDFPSLGRASFRQLPAVPPFDQDVPPPVIWEELTVPPHSTFARTMFLVSNLPGAVTGVQVFLPGCADDDLPVDYGPYKGSCAPITSITLGGEGPSGPLRDPNYQSPACGADPNCTDDVLQAELHNPELINPELINPELINPELINPELINPELINPELINPELINPELINLGFANPELINPELINPELINPELINPELINPELINPELINSSFDDGGTLTLDEDLTWTDYTYIIRNTGNVTTSFNADITLSGDAADDVDSQLVAWTLYITPTSRDCNYRPQVERRVLATVNNPDDELASEELEIATIDEPFNGEISAIATPGQTLFFTRRVFGTPAELANISVSGFTSASQAANCSQTDLPVEDPENPGELYTGEYFCQLTLADERERILLDTQPPAFNLPNDSVVPVPAILADRPGGACVDLVGLGIVSATDNEKPIENITCTDGTGQEICIGTEPGQSIPFSLPGEDGAPISCTAIDDAGNIGQVNLLIDVRDEGDPLFTAFPASVSVIAGDDGIASVDFEAGITVADLDNIDPSVSFSCIADTPEMQGPFDPLPVGTTTINCTVADSSGNETTQSYDITVLDQTPPEFDLPLPVIAPVAANDVNGAAVTYSNPTATDTGGGTPSVTCEPPSGSVLEVGDHDVVCTANDGRGNETQITLIATVTDAVPPEITAPTGTIDVERESPAGATFAYTATATDNVDPNPSIVCDPASGSLFAPGTTTVTCTATDGQGNTNNASFVVNVADTTRPMITTAPTGTIDVERESTAGAVFNYTVTATDSADPAPLVACLPPSGSTFPPGATTVNCTATDNEGNSVATSFVVNVADTTRPIITAAPTGTIDVERESTAGAVFNYTVTATDIADPAPLVACLPPSGSTFPPGITTVTCTATDNEGNSVATSFVVNVADTTRPMITAAPTGTIDVERESTAGAVFNYTVTATDSADPAPLVACLPPSGSTFPPGITTVTCTATDNEGNSDSASFAVDVRDSIDPVISVPGGGIDVEIQSTAGSYVDFNGLLTATDSADPSPVITCVPPSGSLFPPGVTVEAGAESVTCTATDHEGNTASASFLVRVGYADGFGITPRKLNVRAGSSDPLSWGWLASSGAILDTSGDMQILEFSVCGSSTPIFTLAGDPGSSGFRIKADNSWEYNWQSDDGNGSPLAAGFYCVRVTSDLTGQYLDSPQIRVR